MLCSVIQRLLFHGRLYQRREGEIVSIVTDLHRIAFLYIATDDFLGKRRFHCMHQEAAQRAGTEIRIKALISKSCQCLIGPVKRDLDLTLQRSPRLLSMMAAIFLTCSFSRALKTMMSSTRLRNSGRK